MLVLKNRGNNSDNSHIWQLCINFTTIKQQSVANGFDVRTRINCSRQRHDRNCLGHGARCTQRSCQHPMHSLRDQQAGLFSQYYCRPLCSDHNFVVVELLLVLAKISLLNLTKRSEFRTLESFEDGVEIHPRTYSESAPRYRINKNAWKVATALGSKHGYVLPHGGLGRPAQQTDSQLSLLMTLSKAVKQPPVI